MYANASDLHLGNIVLADGQPVPFDGIEFNPALRWIDVMSEIAFTVMDLLHYRRADLAWRFLNAWLEATGDYAGIRVLRFYLVYRAMVRQFGATSVPRSPACQRVPQRRRRRAAVAIWRWLQIAWPATKPR
jgi:aminoglycoside phosphotransferase family enzyme